jgi:uncharacterized membrane protein YgcG
MLNHVTGKLRYALPLAAIVMLACAALHPAFAQDSGGSSDSGSSSSSGGFVGGDGTATGGDATGGG